MKLMKIFAVLTASLALYHVAFAEVKTIRFATEATYPPFEYIDASGDIKGFDIDIAKALCNELHAACTFANQSFSSLIPSLNLGKFDAVVAAMGVTTEREKQVNFTNTYYQPSAAFVGPIDKHYSIKGLNGKKIGVQQGSTFEKYLHDEFHGDIDMKTYASVQDAFLDLTSGRIDVVIADLPIAQTWLQQNDTKKSFAVIDGPIVNAKYFGAGYGIAVSKSNIELLKELNKALDTIKANGTYNKITQKYFGKK